MAGPVIPEYRGPRRRLMELLREQGVSDLAVLRAFDLTPRHLFVPSGIRHRAYDDNALPIGNGQTISQPSTHARYLELLKLTGRERVLEIGTGSGYQTVLLSHLAAQVFSIERVTSLLESARAAIRAAGARNVSLLAGDGTLGWREYAPYDAILITACSPDVPEPLLRQLAEGGRLLAPLGDRDAQVLTLVIRRGETLERRAIAPARFVPLIGRHGWSPDGEALTLRGVPGIFAPEIPCPTNTTAPPSRRAPRRHRSSVLRARARYRPERAQIGRRSLRSHRRS